MDFQNKLCGCAPKQIITFNIPINFNQLSSIKIIDDCDKEYILDDLSYAYSVDNVCWSCYISHSDILRNVVDIKSDFYLRIKIGGPIKSIQIDNSLYTDYSTQLDSAFNFTYCDSSTNMYNPYANMSCAMDLNRQMSDLVCCMFGIPIIYFKLNPSENSKDITFKEYTLMNVEAPKNIKLIVADGQMPSSKPEFSDFGFDFSTDWETEIGKTMFATAFGNTAQPMEGDFIWVPMMKRMWQVTGAYEEKKDALMWNATTFKVSLAKYEEKGSVNLGNMEDLVDSFVKNKYDDLFGDDNEDTSGTNEVSIEAPVSAKDNLYPIFKSDATRKYVTCEGINISDKSTYYKGTVISDSCYGFDRVFDNQKVIYQKQYCGDDITISFIINPLLISDNDGYVSGKILSIGSLFINIEQSKTETTIYVNKDSKLKITINSGETYFVYIRWSKSLNISEICAAKYTYNQAIPLYRLQNGHYYYDLDNTIKQTSKWNIEFSITEKSDITLHNLVGNITNIKVFNIYNDNISEVLQQYPTNNYLILNDTARKLLGLDGVNIR